MEAADFLLQKDWHDRKLAELGTQNWVTVYEFMRSEEETRIIYSALIPDSKVGSALKTTDWEYQIGHGQPGMVTYRDEDGEQHETYEHFSKAGAIQPLVLVRQFHGSYDDYTEILEEFRLFHNLYHDRKRNVLLQFTDDGYEEEVVRIEHKKVQIRLKWIKQFLAFKKMHLLLYFDVKRHSRLKLDGNPLSEDRWEHQDAEIYYSFNIAVDDFSRRDNWHSFSILHGKKLIEPMPIKQTGIWPYEKKRQYESFLIGTDEHGDGMTFSCEVDQLANYFGANPDNPHFLTPVFFRQSVLARYYSDPDKYEVHDGYISLNGRWTLRADTNHEDYVIVYLGDLASIPYSEQQYWRGQNVVPDGTMSEVNIRRSLLGEFADPENPVFLFKYAYEEFQRLWFSTFGWHLFKPLAEEDAYLFTGLHIPLNNSYSEFDRQILALTKTLIDSLNEREVVKLVTEKLEDGIKGISKFEAYLQQEGVDDYETHIAFMRQLQKIRSSSSAHRKSSDFEKKMGKLGIDVSSLATEFRTFVEQANRLLATLDAHFFTIAD